MISPALVTIPVIKAVCIIPPPLIVRGKINGIASKVKLIVLISHKFC